MNAIRLLIHGYIKIDSIPPAEKRRIWNTVILPQLTTHWKTVHNDLNFNLNSELSWPRPENGTSYNSNLTNAIQKEYPKLFSTNFDVQALISYLIDERLQVVSYGEQTHWKLRLLRSSNTSTLSLLCSALKGLLLLPPTSPAPVILNLRGNDHGWNLINWPQSQHPSGTAIPSKAHIDGGECFFYKRGLPVDAATYTEILKQASIPYDNEEEEDGAAENSALDSSAVESDTSIASQRRRRRLSILSMLMWQIAIIFYCDTPGDLTSQEGATGFYTGSHWAIVDALNRITDKVAVSQHGNLTSPKTAVEYADFAKGIKLYGSSRSNRLTQPTIADGQALLCLGQVAHTLMWATKPMMPQQAMMPRSIQNAKVTARELLKPALPPHSPQLAIIQAARQLDRRHSLLAQFAEDPRGLLKQLLRSSVDSPDGDRDGVDESGLLQTIEEDSDFLFEQWSSSKEGREEGPPSS
eukprot:gene28599-37570_t